MEAPTGIDGGGRRRTSYGSWRDQAGCARRRASKAREDLPCPSDRRDHVEASHAGRGRRGADAIVQPSPRDAIRVSHGVAPSARGGWPVSHIRDRVALWAMAPSLLSRLEQLAKAALHSQDVDVAHRTNQAVVVQVCRPGSTARGSAHQIAPISQPGASGTDRRSGRQSKSDGSPGCRSGAKPQSGAS